MNSLTILFLSALGLSVVLQWWLIHRQRLSVTQHRHQVPDAFASQIDLAAHQKAADYSTAKLGVARVDLFYSAAWLLVWTIGGGLEWLDQSWRSLELSNLYTGILVILSMIILSAIIDLPFSLYRTFVIEQKFGFNRMTFSTLLKDMFKSLILLFLLGAPLLAVILWLMEGASPLWWVYVWAVWMGFSLLMMWAMPTFIAPLFNKFTPLEDQALRQRIEALLKRCGFTSNGIFVMDGSSRSSHGNAYFTGLGKNKRIVFFDTLLGTLNEEEVEAVLAHELGHFKRKHLQKRILSVAAFSLAGLAILAWLMKNPLFYSTLGVSIPSTYMALLLFSLVSPLFSIYLSPIMSALSRKHEFEADAFAAEQSSARFLIDALVKLYRDNASTLTPDHLYSAFHDSHPPAPIRVAQLNGKT